MAIRQCLSCGIEVTVSLTDIGQGAAAQYCPKCDSDLFSQSDGSCLTEDIAHHGETITEALSKVDELLVAAYSGYYARLRLVVGGGLIKDEVLGQLYFYQSDNRILSYAEEQHNRGAIIVQIRDNAGA